MADIDAIIAMRARNRAVAVGENEGLALLEADCSAARLCARTLLDKEQLAAGECLSAAAEETRHLERESDFTIEVLMHAVIPARLVIEDQRSRFALAVFSADLQEGFEGVGIALASPE